MYVVIVLLGRVTRVQLRREAAIVQAGGTPMRYPILCPDMAADAGDCAWYLQPGLVCSWRPRVR